MLALATSYCGRFNTRVSERISISNAELNDFAPANKLHGYRNMEKYQRSENQVEWKIVYPECPDLFQIYDISGVLISSDIIRYDPQHPVCIAWT
jgi:hypothetical protein